MIAMERQHKILYLGDFSLLYAEPEPSLFKDVALFDLFSALDSDEMIRCQYEWYLAMLQKRTDKPDSLP